MLKSRLLQLSLFILMIAASSANPQSGDSFNRNESPLPTPTSPVMDYAGVVDAQTKSRIEQKIKAFSKRTNPSVELAVAVVKTTNGRSIFDYSLAVARGWGIGSRADDNPGALLFIAVADRKYFTQVSRDLEDELPDGLVGSLQRRYLVPQFKRQNYAKGIEDTIDAYIRTIEDRKSTVPSSSTTTPATDYADDASSGNEALCGIIGCIAILLIVVFVIFAIRGNKSKPDKKDKDRWGGGGFGGSGGGMSGGEIAIDVIGTVLLGLLSGGSGGGSSSDWGGSSGGDWGGFGGGGDFGGGGAGGGW